MSEGGSAKYMNDETDLLDDPEESLIGDRAPKAPQMQRLGRYRLVREIASGGMASVNLAVADGVDKLVALKMIHAHLAQEDSFVQMFLDEARIASAITHRNVCNVFDFGEVDGRFFLAMDYLSGQSLRDVIHRLRKMPDFATPAKLSVFAATIMAEACEGLHAAHELRDAQGKPLDVIHRDVSPHNLFVTYEGSVSVVDFGIARASDRIQHTATGVLKGKFSYMAPEQIRQLEIDRRVDVWSLGVCLWEMLTLERLFVRNSQADTLMSVMMDRVKPPSETHPGVPKALDAIVMKALARSPVQRYATARDLGRDLAKFVRESGEAMDTVEIEQWLGRLFPREIDENRRLLRNARLASMEESQLFDGTPVGLARTPTRSGAMLRARSMTPSSVAGLHAPVLMSGAPDNDVRMSHEPRSVLHRTATPEGRRTQKLGAIGAALCIGALAAGYVHWGTGPAPVKQPQDLISISAHTPTAPAPSQRTPVAIPAPAAAVLPSEPQAAQFDDAIAPMASKPMENALPNSAGAVQNRGQRMMQGPTPKTGLVSAARGASVSRVEAADPIQKPADLAAAPITPESKVPAESAPTPSVAVVPAAQEAATDAQRAAPSIQVKPQAPAAVAPAVVAPQKLDASAKITELEVNGSLGTGVVGRMLSRAEPLLKSCYVDAAKRAGKNQFVPLTIALTIDETGAVRRIESGKHPLNGLPECAANELKRMRSDRKPDVGTVQVRFSVGFKAP